LKVPAYSLTASATLQLDSECHPYSLTVSATSTTRQGVPLLPGLAHFWEILVLDRAVGTTWYLPGHM